MVNTLELIGAIAGGVATVIAAVTALIVALKTNKAVATAHARIGTLVNAMVAKWSEENLNTPEKGESGQEGMPGL